MFDIDILKDQELQAICNIFISSLLPHENYNSKYFTENLNILLQYIKLEEFSMEYRAMVGALKELSKIKTVREGYEPKLLRPIFESMLEVNIMGMVNNPEYKVAEYLTKEGLPNNLQVPTTKQTAASKLYNRALELYDDCIELKINSAMVIDYQPVLLSAFQTHAIQNILQTQARMLDGGVWVGKHYYNGKDDWYSFVDRASKEVKRRVESEISGMSIKVDNLATETEFVKKLQELYIPICNYGIPALDDETPILKHRLAVFAANENVGKTMIAKDLATRVILSGHKCLFICGETQREQIWAATCIAYIWKKYNKTILMDEFTGKEELPERERTLVNLALAELRSSGLLSFRTTLVYGNAYDQLKAEYEREPFDAVFIDHSLAQDGTLGSNRQDVDSVARDTKNFKIDFPVYVGVLSHLSADAKISLDKGVPITKSPTRESQALSTEADELFILHKNENLTKMGLIAWIVYKRRGAELDNKTFYIRTRFNTHSWEYRDEDQVSFTHASVGAMDAIKALDSRFDDIE